MALRAEALTPKDREDLVFGIKAGVDYIALSFVRQPGDMDQARAAMAEAGRQVPIIAKLEKPEAIARLDAILEKTDGVMVARGDLGVEIPPEEVPAIQKDIIRRANLRGLPVIVATQMLNSMIEHPRPTRAEASDVANAVFDGADALMLSGETASGSYPMESVQMMERIILAAESAARTHGKAPARIGGVTFPASFPDVIAGVACEAARAAGAVVIAAFTLSGHTARLLAHYRPPVPIVAFSPEPGGATEALAPLGRGAPGARAGGPHRGDGPPRRGGAAQPRPRPPRRPGGDRLRRAGRPAGEDQQHAAPRDRLTCSAGADG